MRLSEVTASDSSSPFQLWSHVTFWVAVCNHHVQKVGGTNVSFGLRSINIKEHYKPFISHLTGMQRSDKKARDLALQEWNYIFQSTAHSTVFLTPAVIVLLLRRRLLSETPACVVYSDLSLSLARSLARSRSLSFFERIRSRTESCDVHWRAETMKIPIFFSLRVGVRGAFSVCTDSFIPKPPHVGFFVYTDNPHLVFSACIKRRAFLTLYSALM